MFFTPQQRPGTCPSPQFIFADAKRGSQLQQPLLQAIAQSNRNRGLPARSNSMMGPMVIEGSRTGEEKLVSLVDKREAVSVKPSTPMESSSRGGGGDGQAARDAMRLKKLEGEIKKLQEMARKRTSEKEEADRRAEEYQGLLNESNRRTSERELELQTEIKDRGEEIQTLRSDVERANARLKRSAEELANRESGSKAADLKLRDLADVQQRLDAMRSAMQQQIDSLKAEGKLLREAGEAAESKFSAASREAAVRNERLQSEIATMRADQVRVTDERDRLSTELKSREETLNEWKTRIDQCRKYIVKICQPSFTVVKDESLTPIGPEDKDGGGFVLVPLALMLEGYTLLPTDMKKKIADDYETTKASKKLEALTEDPYTINQPRKPVPTSSFSTRAKK